MMNAWELTAFGIENLRRVERRVPVPGDDDVLVRVLAVALNPRDRLLVDGAYDPDLAFPMVQGSDLVGIVTRVGANVTRARPGDRVAANFATLWLAGPPTRNESDVTLGNRISGALAHYVALDQQIVVRVPDYLSDEEAATLPCAAVTAWYALTERAHLEAGQRLLVQGTGGVSLFALQIGSALGADVIVTSGSDEKLAMASRLGAFAGINSRTHPEWDVEVSRLTDGRGVDHAIETVGGDNLARTIRSVRYGGSISLIGFLGGLSAGLPLVPLITRQLTLNGSTVGSRAAFEAMLGFFDRVKLRPIVERVYGFDEVIDGFEHLSRGAFGKIVISLERPAAR